MSRAIDKHRIANRQYRDGLDALLGDDSSNSDANLYANLFAEVAQGVGKTVAQKQADTAAKKKADDAKKASDAASADLNAAKLDLAQKQKAAMNAQADAHAAQMKATTETDPKGPLHQAAQKAAVNAANYAADAAAAQDRVNFYSAGGTGTPPGGALTKHGGKTAGMPSWVMPVGIGVGVLGVGVIGYKLLTRRKGRR